MYSATGSARDLLQLALTDRVRLLVSQDILDEVSRNLSKKAPDVVPIFDRLVGAQILEITATLSADSVATAAAYTTAKDAHVIAAAISAKVDYLVTYDRKHLIEPPQVAEKSGLVIVTPREVVQAIDAEDASDT